MFFIDANIFIRLLTQDNANQSPRAFAFMNEIANGEIDGMTTEGVLLEVVQVLVSKNLYALDRSTIRELLLPIITIENLHIPNRDVHLAALDLFAETRLDYVDCLAIAYVHSLDLEGIASFDRGLDRHANGLRVEPGPLE